MGLRFTVLGILLCCGSLLFGQNEGLKFRNYGIRDGLSQSSIMSIWQDKKGFMWFGTSDGLNQFDGYKFKIYKNNFLSSNSLSDNWIGLIFEDSKENLWVLTVDKVFNRINLRTQEVSRFAVTQNCPQDFHQLNIIYSIKEDKHSNIWFASDAGLCRFNRRKNQFEFFVNEPNCPSAIKGNVTHLIYEDNSGTIWFSSEHGLYSYQYGNGGFSRYVHQSGNATSILSDKTIRVFEDKRKNFWVVTESGLSLYHKQSNTFQNYPFSKPVAFEVPNKLNSALEDKKGNIWISSPDGLFRFDRFSSKFSLYRKTPAPKSLSSNYVTKVYEDKLGCIWVGTDNGLNKFNPSENNFDTYINKSGDEGANFVSMIWEDKNNELFTMSKSSRNQGSYLLHLNKTKGSLEIQENDKCNPNSIASTYVSQPFRDNSGTIWFRSFGDGIIQYIPRSQKFEHYMARPGNPEFLNGNSVWGFAEDKHGKIYIPLYYNGLDIFDPQTRTFTHLSPKENKILRYYLCGIQAGASDDLWISTDGGGIIRYNTEKKTFKEYRNIPGDPGSLSNSSIRKIVTEPSGNLWLATAGGGLDYFDVRSEKTTHYRNDPNNGNSLTSNNTWTAMRDRSGNIWVSCDGSIDKFNPVSKTFTHYKSKGTDSTGLLSDKALDILEDSKGNIWFGTSGGGLSRLDRKTRKFRHWTENEGLPNNVVYGILEDENGRLWLSTNRGLSRFDVKANSFWNFYESDGLQSNEFNMGSFYRSSDNKMYFGGINGFNSFYPQNIKKDTVTPTTVITGLQIFNKTVPVIPPDKRSLALDKASSNIIRINDALYLPQDITYSKEITLTYREKVFTLEFAALSFESPERTTYRYKMENFDNDWNLSENRHFATYTNLPAGEYTFKVTAANSSGVWNPNPTILKIRVLPPFWKTWWFILGESMFVFGLIILLMLVRVRSLQHAKAALEKKVNERTHEIKEKNEELELRNLQIMRQKEEIAFQAQQLKNELTAQNQTSELALLRSQINPHFLFNTLNNIYSLVYQRAESAPEAVMKLSEIMRYMLYEATSEKVLLQNEINYLKSFIELQLLRIKNRDFVAFNVTGNVGSRTISPMLLIAFVENAFKHGVKRGINPGIIINLDVLDNSINFEVFNYCGKNDSLSKDATGGIGLANIKRRLELLHPNKFTFDIINGEGVYHVKLSITE